MYLVSRILRLLAAALLAAHLPSAVVADEHNAAPAVSGFNTRLSAEGGIYDDEESGLLQGSLTTPLGHAYGFQLDGALGTIDGEVMGGGAAHVFTRDPGRYLLGLYGSFHTWDSIDISRLAVEAEVYRGRVTLSGIAGWENIDVPGTRGGLAVVNSDDDHFFNEFDLSYYPQDNLRLSIGYHYESEESLGVAEIEYMTGWRAAPAALFATAYVGDDDYTRLTGGLRFYFGQDQNKSLIRRHREDDPALYTPVWPKIVTMNPMSSTQPNICPSSGTFAVANYPGCTCPGGNPPSIYQGSGTCDEPE